MKWWNRILARGILQALLWVAVGVLLLCWPQSAARLLCYVLGATLIALGVVQSIGAFRKENGRFYMSVDLLSGVAALAVGLWSVISPDTAKGLIPVLLAVVILMHGFEDCVAAWRLRGAGYRKWWLCLLFALLTLLAGVLILWKPGAVADVLLRVTGFLLLYDAVTDFWIYLLLGKWLKDVEKAVEDK